MDLCFRPSLLVVWTLCLFPVVHGIAAGKRRACSSVSPASSSVIPVSVATSISSAGSSDITISSSTASAEATFSTNAAVSSTTISTNDAVTTTEIEVTISSDTAASFSTSSADDAVLSSTVLSDDAATPTQIECAQMTHPAYNQEYAWFVGSETYGCGYQYQESTVVDQYNGAVLDSTTFDTNTHSSDDCMALCRDNDCDFWDTTSWQTPLVEETIELGSGDTTMITTGGEFYFNCTTYSGTLESTNEDSWSTTYVESYCGVRRDSYYSTGGGCVYSMFWGWTLPPAQAGYTIASLNVDLPSTCATQAYEYGSQWYEFDFMVDPAAGEINCVLYNGCQGIWVESNTAAVGVIAGCQK